MRSVLIVEDQPEIRELIRITLEFDNYQIDEAGTGPEGLEKAAAMKPDLMLLDVMMPGGIDGVEVCKRIRANPALRKTKIIMLSAKSQSTDRAAGKSAGADEYLTKPFSPLELMEVIHRVLR
jgi:DNA-binding response OmpR family regulator